jgi:3-deoxy-7-phosphoheptulonate synthase
MVIVMKQDQGELTKNIRKRAEKLGLQVIVTYGAGQNILALVGDTQKVELGYFAGEEGVEKVYRIQEPYKLASRYANRVDTIIDVDGVKIGGDNFTIMAGPCSVENEDQIIQTAIKVKEYGGEILRGGAFKPRTSPYSFQGLGVEGLKLLRKAKEATGLPIITELMDPHDFDSVYEYADIIQIGARNMANFALLKEVGRCDKPVMLKRGMSSTIKEFLMSAEYIMSEGNEEVILCERGIRTFETHMRNTLDLNIVTAIREMSHLPIIIDPSHATGKASMIEPASRATAAIGAHGLIIEVHNNPHEALCDGAQSLTPEEFKILNDKVRKIHKFVNGGGLC